MAQKRKKRKRKKPENESYEIEIQDWEVYFHFGTHMGRNRFDDGDFSEASSLSLTGKIVSPILKNGSKAEINIWESQELDDHWRDGKPLEYEQIELPDLPLVERAQEWEISVKAIPGNYRYHGYYSSGAKEIALATPEEKTFFHELSHAAHEKIKGSIKDGQDPLQEIIAELSAQALCRMVGKQLADTTGNSYRYIEGFADKIKMNPYTACLKVMSETEKVLNLVLKGEKHPKQIAA